MGCQCMCLASQASRVGASRKDADNQNRERAAEEDKDKLAKLAKIQCYKCKQFGHYATRCPTS